MARCGLCNSGSKHRTGQGHMATTNCMDMKRKCRQVSACVMKAAACHIRPIMSTGFCPLPRLKKQGLPGCGSLPGSRGIILKKGSQFSPVHEMLASHGGNEALAGARASCRPRGRASCGQRGVCGPRRTHTVTLPSRSAEPRTRGHSGALWNTPGHFGHLPRRGQRCSQPASGGASPAACPAWHACRHA